MSEDPKSTWSDVADGKAAKICTPKVHGEFLDLRTEVRTIARQNGWSKAEVSRRSDIPNGTFSEWFSGLYKGRYENVNERVRKWLAAIAEMSDIGRTLPSGPGYVQTRTAREVTEALTYAQMLPEMLVCTLGSGMGKTMAARQYNESRPHTYLATMSPSTRSVNGMLNEIAYVLGVSEGSTAKLHRRIGQRLSRNPKSLLILDEAQNLCDEAVDQARAFLDQFECGIALMGNEEIYTRFERKSDGPSYAQIRRRIGVKMRRVHPYASDIKDLIEAWGVEEPAAKKLLVGIGNKAGALGQIDKTMKLATLLARGSGEDLTEEHIKAAWKNRGMEDM